MNVHYINFWSGFTNTLPWLEHNLDLTVNYDRPADIVVSSVFGPLEYVGNYKNAIKILFTRENLDRADFSDYKNTTAFDFVFGFNTDAKNNHLRLPYWYTELWRPGLQQYRTLLVDNIVDISNKTEDICLISKNKHKLRLDILSRLSRAGVIVHCPGRAGHNLTGVGPSVSDKLRFISQYYINICPENSYATGYTTEKLFHAAIAGCIPVYWGCCGLDGGIYNKDKILYIEKDKNNISDVIDRISYLLQHRSELIELARLSPFTRNISQITQTKIEEINNFFDKIRAAV